MFDAMLVMLETVGLLVYHGIVCVLNWRIRVVVSWHFEVLQEFWRIYCLDRIKTYCIASGKELASFVIGS